MELKELQVPGMLKKCTQLQGPQLQGINEERAEKLELASRNTHAQRSALEQQIEQTREQCRVLQRENAAMLTTLKNLQFQRIPDYTRELNAQKADVDKAKANKKRLTQTLAGLQQEKSRLDSELSRPYTGFAEAQKRIQDLQTSIDETEIKQQETIGMSECFKAVIARLQQERLRFEKELDFQRVEARMLEKDELDIVAYVRESFQALKTVQSDRDVLQQRLQAQLEQQETLLRQKTEEKDRQLAEPLPFLEDHVALDSGGSSADVEQGKLNIRAFVQAKGIATDLDAWQARAFAQGQQLIDLEAQINDNSGQLRNLTAELNKQRTDIAEAQFQLSNQGNLKPNKGAELELLQKRKQRTASLVSLQRIQRLQSETRQSVRHVYELVSIFKSNNEIQNDLDFASTVPSMEAAVASIIAKLQTVDLLLNDQPESESQSKDIASVFQTKNQQIGQSTGQSEVPITSMTSGTLQLTAQNIGGSFAVSGAMSVTGSSLGSGLTGLDYIDDFQISGGSQSIGAGSIPVAGALPGQIAGPGRPGVPAALPPQPHSRKEAESLLRSTAEARKRAKMDSDNVVLQNTKQDGWYGV